MFQRFSINQPEQKAGRRESQEEGDVFSLLLFIKKI